MLLLSVQCIFVATGYLYGSYIELGTYHTSQAQFLLTLQILYDYDVLYTYIYIF